MVIYVDAAQNQWLDLLSYLGRRIQHLRVLLLAT
jgi:hypothetical protein